MDKITEAIERVVYDACDAASESPVPAAGFAILALLTAFLLGALV